MWACHDERDHCDVAVKVVSFATETNNARRALREFRSLQDLTSPNIVRILDSGQNDDAKYFYIAMTMIDGRPLSQLLSREPLQQKQALPILRDVAEALIEAHSKGITHRDIKPENIMIQPTGHAILLDFGIAHLADQSVSLTPSESVIGTFPYIAPELFEGQDASPASDVYSFGVVAYKCITGTCPFGEGTPASIVAAVFRGQYPPPQCTPPLRDLITSMLDRDPTRRPQIIDVVYSLKSITADANSRSALPHVTHHEAANPTLPNTVNNSISTQSNPTEVDDLDPTKVDTAANKILNIIQTPSDIPQETTKTSKRLTQVAHPHPRPKRTTQNSHQYSWTKTDWLLALTPLPFAIASILGLLGLGFPTNSPLKVTDDRAWNSIIEDETLSQTERWYYETSILAFLTALTLSYIWIVFHQLNNHHKNARTATYHSDRPASSTDRPTKKSFYLEARKNKKLLHILTNLCIWGALAFIAFLTIVFIPAGITIGAALGTRTALFWFGITVTEGWIGELILLGPWCAYVATVCFVVYCGERS